MIADASEPVPDIDDQADCMTWHYTLWRNLLRFAVKYASNGKVQRSAPVKILEQEQ